MHQMCEIFLKEFLVYFPLQAHARFCNSLQLSTDLRSREEQAGLSGAKSFGDTREDTTILARSPQSQDLSQLQFPTPEIQKIRKIQLLIIPACPGQKTHGTNGGYPRTKRTNICPVEIATIKGRKMQGFYVFTL